MALTLVDPVLGTSTKMHLCLCEIIQRRHSTLKNFAGIRKWTLRGSVAQSVEQRPFKALVPGSSPGRPNLVNRAGNFAADPIEKLTGPLLSPLPNRVLGHRPHGGPRQH